MWSRNGSGIQFPEDSAITVGGQSPIQLLVLQVHYIDNSNISPMGDDSGVLVKYHSSPIRPKYNIGIFSLHNHGIAKAKGLSSWESACQLDFPQPELPLIPVAFLTHTHQLGVFSGGWVVQNGEWKLIGKGNPQAPQSFYPVENQTLEIHPQDKLAMKCIMSSGRRYETLQGLSKMSEMCDYFVMYKTLGRVLTNNSCTTDSSFTWKEYGLVQYP